MLAAPAEQHQPLRSGGLCQFQQLPPPTHRTHDPCPSHGGFTNQLCRCPTHAIISWFKFLRPPPPGRVYACSCLSIAHPERRYKGLSLDSLGPVLKLYILTSKILRGPPSLLYGRFRATVLPSPGGNTVLDIAVAPILCSPLLPLQDKASRRDGQGRIIRYKAALHHRLLQVAASCSHLSANWAALHTLLGHIPGQGVIVPVSHIYKVYHIAVSADSLPLLSITRCTRLPACSVPSR